MCICYTCGFMFCVINKFHNTFLELISSTPYFFLLRENGWIFRYAHDGCKSREGKKGCWIFFYFCFGQWFLCPLFRHRKTHLYKFPAQQNRFVFWNVEKNMKKEITSVIVLFYALTGNVVIQIFLLCLVGRWHGWCWGRPIYFSFGSNR